MKKIWVPQVTSTIFLLWALNPENPYGYYILLRWVLCACFGYLTFRSIEFMKKEWAIVLGITAVIYNPIFRIHLNREIWSVLNIATIGIAIASIFTLKPSVK